MDKETQPGSQKTYEAHISTKDARPILHLPSKGSAAKDLRQGSANGEESDSLHGRSLAEPPKGSAEATTDKFARCEVSPSAEAASELPKAPDKPVAGDDTAKAASPCVSAAPPTEPEQVPASKSGLEQEIERCCALGGKSDPMVVEKWGKRNGPILEQSLRFTAAYQAASEEEKKANRKKLKLKSGVSREPNADNLAVIAVYLCVSCSGKTQSKKQRNEWCRFATVVKVAAATSIAPSEAAKWLETKTLKGLLAEWRDMKKAAGGAGRKAAVPKELKEYPLLAAALQNNSEFQALAKTELAKANAAIAKAMEQAAALQNASKQESLQAKHEMADA